MKQRITIEQLNELTDEQMKRLREWWYPNNVRLYDQYAIRYKYDDVMRFEPAIYLGDYFRSEKPSTIFDDVRVGEALPLLSIGQMIEFIHFKRKRISIDTSEFGWEVVARTGDEASASIQEELCDALWETVKRIIE